MPLKNIRFYYFLCRSPPLPARRRAANAVAMGAFDEYKRDAEQRLPAGWSYMVRRHAAPMRIPRTAAA